MSSPRHAGLWHLLGEVEVVFGFWAMVLIVFMATQIGTGEALGYLESRNFTEPAFVFVIMVIAASRPVLDFAAASLSVVSRLLPMPRNDGLLLHASVRRSAARLVHHRACGHDAVRAAAARALFRPQRAQQLHVCHGRRAVRQCVDRRHAHALCRAARADGRGALGLRSCLHAHTFRLEGGALPWSINAAGVAFLFRNYLRELAAAFAHRLRNSRCRHGSSACISPFSPPSWSSIITSSCSSHCSCSFSASPRPISGFQSPLILREGLLVGFFLAGLVVIGGQQKWWLQPLLV